MNNNDVLKLPAAKLKRILALRTRIERLEAQLAEIASHDPGASQAKSGRKKWTMSTAARKRISRAAKARWAKIKAAASRSAAK